MFAFAAQWTPAKVAGSCSGRGPSPCEVSALLTPFVNGTRESTRTPSRSNNTAS